jgi:deazaflavin-dependent oxidoreductase (nitroreductase family)
VLYRTGLGGLFGHRLLYLVHKGRKSGRRRETVLEVVRYDPRAPEVVVVSGWGERSDWYRNIAAAPAIEIRCGGQHWPKPRHHVLDATDTVRLLQDYRDLHPRAWRRIAPMLGFPRDPGDAAAREDGLAGIRAVSFAPEGNP